MFRRERDTFVSVCCPTCFQVFEVAGPAPEECPAEWDYDCEVCCRPMVIRFESDGADLWADARGIND
jgi:Cysteine-rich CPXCG